MTKTRALWLLFFLAVFIYGALVYPLLPETIASHFSHEGKPDAWAGKGSFFLYFFAIMVFTNALCWGLVKYLRKISWDYVSIPWKDYWSERKEEAYEKIAAMVDISAGVGMNAVYLLALHLVVQSNQVDTLQLPFGGSIVAAILAIPVLTAYAILGFKPSAEKQ